MLWLTFIPGAFVSVAVSGLSEKTIYLFSLTLLAVLLPQLIGLSNAATQTWLFGLLALGLLLGVSSLIFPDAVSADYLGRLDVEGGTTITTSRALGSVIVLAFATIAGTARDSLWRLLSLVVAVVAAILMLLVGSRGPFLSVGIAIPLILITARLRSRARILGLAGFLAFAVVVGKYLVSNAQSSLGVLRISEFLAGNATDNARSLLYSQTIEAAAAAPAGIGWGEFAFLPLGSRFNYPHNLILEVWLEGGIIALAGLIVFTFSALWRLQRASVTPGGLALYALAIYWLIAAQFSSDINGNRVTLACLAFGFSLLYGQDRLPSTAPTRKGAPTGDSADLRTLFARTPRSGRLEVRR